jgi:hypothetical protein
MLDREPLDALYICVPPSAHGEIELSAIDRKLPFCAERPLAADLATARLVLGYWLDFTPPLAWSVRSLRSRHWSTGSTVLHGRK